MRQDYTILPRGLANTPCYAHCAEDSNEPGVWWIHSISVPRNLRQCGYGTKLLKSIIRDADKDGIQLNLIAASGCRRFLTQDLRKWYASHGFIPSLVVPCAMFRFPNTQEQAMLDVSIDEKKKTMTIVIDLNEPHRSKSGATMVIASTGGNQRTDAKYKGHQVTVGLNAYFKED